MVKLVITKLFTYKLAQSKNIIYLCTMKTGKLLSKAIAIASEAFVDCYDKGGQPYILHCLYVMHKVKHLGHEAMICGVMHDILEDCKQWDISKLRDEGFTEDILVVLDLLTHKDGQDYLDHYIKTIERHPIAKAIKMADLEHNSKITRLKGLRKKDFDRMEKYLRAYEYLRN